MNLRRKFVQVVEFREQEDFTFLDFKNMFETSDLFSDEELKDILNRLELSHCLKHHIPLQDVPDNQEVSEFLDFSAEKYKFTFVGIVVVKSISFLVYPKYWKRISEEPEKVRKFTQILAVINKYYISNRTSNIGIDSSEGNNRLANLIHLLQDYVTNGLYSNEELIIEINGEGQILWEKTINESTPYVNYGSPIYLDMYTQANVMNQLDEMRRLHAAIIAEVGKEINSILGYINLDFDFQITDEEISDFGPEDYILYLIDRELSRQFITKKQEILISMKRYIKNYYKRSDSSVQLYGTTSFNLVWEKVCSEVYRSDLDKDMKSLGLRKARDNKELSDDAWNRLKLAEYVEKPVWIHDEKVAKALKTLILDGLQIDIEAKTFRIFDAKYYKIKFDVLQNEQMRISGQPGVADVTKQYLYQLAYKKLAEENDYKFSNGFIVPKDDLIEEELSNGLGQGQLLGRVKMEMLSNLGLLDIIVIGRDCCTMFEQYLRG